MRKLFIKARDYLDDGLRGMCGRLTPGKRVAAIVGMVVVFAGVNFYMLFRAVYNIGREDARREKVIEITPAQCAGHRASRYGHALPADTAGNGRVL